MQQRQAELEAARLAKEKEEEEFRQQALVAKKEKEIQKKAIKKERQKLRTTCKVFKYYYSEIHVILMKLLYLLRSNPVTCLYLWLEMGMESGFIKNQNIKTRTYHMSEADQIGPNTAVAEECCVLSLCLKERDNKVQELCRTCISASRTGITFLIMRQIVLK